MKTIKFLIAIILIPILIPHLLCSVITPERKKIRIDTLRWNQVIHITDCKISGIKYILALLYLLLYVKEYRNLFYLRCGKLKFFLLYLPPLSTLYINTDSKNFGEGTYIQHGFATVITAKKIGKNCWINQQVTIGYNDSKKYGFGAPIIEDNVRVSCGAKVVGNIRIGENSVIGVNAVCVKDVPKNTTVIPSPMRFLRN